MDVIAVVWTWIEATTTKTSASDVEESMSNLKYAIVEEEMETASGNAAAVENRRKPFMVIEGQKRSGDTLTRRVEAALDADFANGSMPA